MKKNMIGNAVAADMQELLRSPEFESLFSKSFKKEASLTMEQAHPEPAVILPAHDKINGLVENEMERQNININVIRDKKFHVFYSHKYAADQLSMELIRIANDLDNRDKTELRSLADECLNKLSPIKKEAIGPLAIVAGAAAAILGTIWVYQHISSANQGLTVSLQDATSKLDNLKDDSDFGENTLKQEFKTSLQQFKYELFSLLAETKQFESIKSKVFMPSSHKQLMDMGKTLGAEAKASVTKFSENLKERGEKITDFIDMLGNTEYVRSQIQEESVVRKIMGPLKDLWSGKGKWSLMSDDFERLQMSLKSLAEAINSTNDLLENRLAAFQEKAAETIVNREKKKEESEKKKEEAKKKETAPPQIPGDEEAPATTVPAKAPATTVPANYNTQAEPNELEQADRAFQNWQRAASLNY